MGLSLTVPQSVSQNIARAKSLFKRDEPIRAIDALITGLSFFEPGKLLGKARYEIEVSIIECVQEMNRQPEIRQFIQEVSRSSSAQVSYSPGKEATLQKILPIIRKVLIEAGEKALLSAQKEIDDRRLSLEEKSLAYIKEKDFGKAKASLRRYIDEFGDVPGVSLQAGKWLLEAELPYDAVEFFEQAMSSFPRESEAYGLASKCYVDLHEYEKAESVYLNAIKEFGRHAQTFLNLAKVYVALHKREKAFETAQEALRLDPENAEAKELYDRLS